MPNWQSVQDAVDQLASVQTVLSDALRLSIESRNAEAVPALKVLAQEVEQLLHRVLDSFADDSAAFA